MGTLAIWTPENWIALWAIVVPALTGIVTVWLLRGVQKKVRAIDGAVNNVEHGVPTISQNARRAVEILEDQTPGVEQAPNPERMDKNIA